MTSELAVWDDVPRAEEGRKTSSRPVDLVHLSRYTLGERELEREVLELFCSQSLIYIERLQTARSDKDWKRRRPLAQRLGNGDRRLARRRARPRTPRRCRARRLPRRGRFACGEIESSVREAEDYIGTLLEDR